MNKQLELVKEFQETFQQPILSKDQDISVERRKLKLALLFEELTELAEAYGLKGEMVNICEGYCSKEWEAENSEILNKVEVLDATGDLTYILAGTILENGQQEVFDNAFEDIHNSNMSKLCISMVEEVLTINKYHNENIEVYSKKLNEKYIGIFRKSDNKILKNINYKTVDLNKYI